MLLYENWSDRRAEEIQQGFQDSLDVIKWAYREYGGHLVYACSFGAEGIVLLDLISKVNKEAKIVFLDTDFHFPETYRLIDQVKERYPQFNITMLKPAVTPAEQEKTHGPKLWLNNPDLCCQIRKVEPLRQALTGAKAWLSGLRREQSETRRHVQYINKDNKFKSVKVCPLIHWTWKEIWDYIRAFSLPYNVLHDQGYPSIGCKHCTLPVSDPGDLRSGRWAQTGKTECGLHLSS